MAEPPETAAPAAPAASVDPADPVAPEEPTIAAERAMLGWMLDRQRAEIAAILDALADLPDPETAGRERLVPSLTTPMGLVTHATFVERVWFHHRVAGVPRAELGLPDTVDASFRIPPEATLDTLRTSYHAACARSREIAAEHDLDTTFTWHDRTVTLRFVHLHMVAELARHAGHADILLEQLAAR